VKTASEWSTAWRHAARATSFVFKHRKQELDDYGEYIECLFAAKHDSAHCTVILYDSAICTFIAGGQQTLLTDVNRFTHLYATIVMPDGIDHASGSYHRTTQSSAKSKICNKFNNGTCTARDDEWRYLHTCKGYGQTGHGEKSCPNK
ncbi:hypothetical protein CPB84DRAFT_1688841, partial [Gymnopilus junonius]